jgi:hypothetical protein
MSMSVINSRTEDALAAERRFSAASPQASSPKRGPGVPLRPLFLVTSNNSRPIASKSPPTLQLNRLRNHPSHFSIGSKSSIFISFTSAKGRIRKKLTVDL